MGLTWFWVWDRSVVGLVYVVFFFFFLEFNLYGLWFI